MFTTHCSRETRSESTQDIETINNSVQSVYHKKLQCKALLRDNINTLVTKLGNIMNSCYYYTQQQYSLNYLHIKTLCYRVSFTRECSCDHNCTTSLLVVVMQESSAVRCQITTRKFAPFHQNHYTKHATKLMQSYQEQETMFIFVKQASTYL